MRLNITNRSEQRQAKTEERITPANASADES